MPAISGSRTRSIIGRAWPPSTTLSAAAVMPRCASAATATAAPCAPSPTACCRWPAPCSNSRRCSTPATRFGTPPAREHPPAIPLFDRARPSLRPDLPPGRATRAAAVKDAAAHAAAPAEPAQSVLDRASTVLPLPWRPWPCTTGCHAGLPPRFFLLDHWWEVRSLQRRVWFDLAAHAARDLSLPRRGEGAILGPTTTPNPGNVGSEPLKGGQHGQCTKMFSGFSVAAFGYRTAGHCCRPRDRECCVGQP